MTTLDDALTSALRAAPELQTAPSVALGIAQDSAADPSADPVQSAQVVAHVGNTQAVQQATAQVNAKANHPDAVHKVLGWFSDFGGGVVSALNPINRIGAPLREVQHDYRAVHDIEARDGPIAGVGAALGIGTGAVLGSLVEPGEGTVLGGEIAAAGIARLSPGGSFARTSSGANYQGTYNRETGQYEGPKGMVSIGRDLASGALRLKPGSTPYGAASAVTDFLSDMYLDPVAKIGHGIAAAKSAEGMTGGVTKGLIGTTFSHAPQGATDLLRADDLENRVAQLPTVKRAFTELAGMSSADVIKNYPKLSYLADPLGRASSADEVTDVFRNALMAHEMTSATLPSMSLTRVPFVAVSRAIQDWGGPGQNAIRSVTSLLPTYFDKATLDLSNKGFNLGDPEAVQGVYRVMRYTQSRDAASAIAAEFAASMDNPGKQIDIYKNGVRAMLQAKGLGDTQFLDDTLDELTQRAMGGGDAFYGVAQDGRDLSKVNTLTGAKSLGILQSQAGKLAFPDFNSVTAAVRDLNRWKSYYGTADDWVYDHFTQGVFKRLVLLSGGFAQRIAMAETIPAMLRNGPLSILRSRLSASTAKAFAENPEEEINTVTNAARALGGVDRLVGDTDKTAFAVDLLHDNGSIAPLAISTTTPSATVTPVEKATRNIYSAFAKAPDNMKLGDEFGRFSAADTPRAQYLDAWQRSLSTISNDPATQAAAQGYRAAVASGADAAAAEDAGTAAAKEWWDSQPANVQNQMARHFVESTDTPGIDPHEAWARTITQNMIGATHAPLAVGGAPHMELLTNVANGEITAQEALAKIPEEQRPLVVIGRKPLPDTTGTIERIANLGFKKVLDPVIDFLSREPLYLDEAYRQYKYIKPLVDSGDMLAEDARQLAQVRAVNGVLPFIHNTLERSQFSQLARNFMPFWFAQEQSYKRFGRILGDDPGAFRQFQLMISGLHEVGSTSKDPNGQSWLQYPGAGFLSAGAAKLAAGIGVPMVGSVPTSFSGQLKSLNTIFPFAEGVRPGFGPVVAIPSHLIENLFPELTPAVHAIIGDQAASGSIYDQLIPNQTLKGLVQALDPGMRSRAMQNAAINTLQYIDKQNQDMQAAWVKAGKDPNDPNIPHVPGSLPTDSAMDRQGLISRVKNQTRVTFLFKTALGAVTPAAPVTNVGDWGLRQEYRDLIAKDGVVAAHDEFLQKHPDGTAYTVFASKQDAGAPLPANLSGQNWINANLDLLHKYPNAAAWFVPQFAGEQFSQGVYNEQMAQHLREHKSLDQMQTDLWVAAGNDQFYNRLLPSYKAQLKAAQEAGDSEKASAIRKNFGDYITNVAGPQNPVWWDDLQSQDRLHNRDLAVKQMNLMFATGDVPDSPMTADLAALLQNFNNYSQAKASAASDPTVTQTQLKQQWQAYMDKLAVEKPTLQPVIQSVFREM